MKMISTVAFATALAMPAMVAQAEPMTNPPSFIASKPMQNVSPYGIFDKDAPLPAVTSGVANAQGKQVIDSDGKLIGHVLTVDTGNRLLDVQLPTGMSVAMRSDLLMEEGSQLVAPTVTHSDVVSMQKTQTGGTDVQTDMLG